MTTDKADRPSGATEVPEEALDDIQGAGMTLRTGKVEKTTMKDASAAIQETRLRGNMTDP